MCFIAVDSTDFLNDASWPSYGVCSDEDDAFFWLVHSEEAYIRFTTDYIIQRQGFVIAYRSLDFGMLEIVQFSK